MIFDDFQWFSMICGDFRCFAMILHDFLELESEFSIIFIDLLKFPKKTTLKSVKCTYSSFFNRNDDDPNARILLADIRNPFDRVLSDTIKLPISIGSMLGISKAGMPFTRYGRNVSILVSMHPMRFGSFFLQMCK